METPIEEELRGERAFLRQLEVIGNSWGLMPVGRQLGLLKDGQQRLDVLAMDKSGRPWVFEFKRDVVEYVAIGQLLMYGAILAQMTTGKVFQLATQRDSRLKPENLFRQHFKQSPPVRQHASVCLVLVGFSFSPLCVLLLDFLRATCGLHIGLITMKLIDSDEYGQAEPHFRWDRQPMPATANTGMGFPQMNFLCTLKGIVDGEEVWLKWRNLNCLELREDWLKKVSDLIPGSGIFVQLMGRGLVGYGVLHEAKPVLIDHKRRELVKWRYVVDWHWQAPSVEQTVEVEVASKRRAPLVELDDPARLLAYRRAAGLVPKVESEPPSIQLTTQLGLFVPNQFALGKRLPRGSAEFQLERRREADELFEAGYAPAEVARELGVSVQTGSRWAKSWAIENDRNGPKGVRRGRTSKLSSKQLASLKKALATEPPSELMENGRTKWSAIVLKRFIKRRFKISYSRSYCYKFLKSLGAKSAPK